MVQEVILKVLLDLKNLQLYIYMLVDNQDQLQPQLIQQLADLMVAVLVNIQHILELQLMHNQVEEHLI